MRKLIVGVLFLVGVAAALVIIDMDDSQGIEDVRVKVKNPEQQQKVMLRLKEEMEQENFDHFLESLTVALTAKELLHAKDKGTSPDPEMKHARDEIHGMTVKEVIEFAKPYVEDAKAKRIREKNKQKAIQAEVEKVELIEDEFGYEVPEVKVGVEVDSEYSPERLELEFEIGDTRFTDFIDTPDTEDGETVTVTHRLDMMEPAAGDVIDEPDSLRVVRATRYWENGKLHDIP